MEINIKAFGLLEKISIMADKRAVASLEFVVLANSSIKISDFSDKLLLSIKPLISRPKPLKPSVSSSERLPAKDIFLKTWV